MPLKCPACFDRLGALGDEAQSKCMISGRKTNHVTYSEDFRPQSLSQPWTEINTPAINQPVNQSISPAQVIESHHKLNAKAQVSFPGGQMPHGCGRTLMPGKERVPNPQARMRGPSHLIPSSYASLLLVMFNPYPFPTLNGNHEHNSVQSLR